MFVKIVVLGLKRMVVPRSVVVPTTAERALGLAQLVLLAVQLAVALDGELQHVRQRVDHRDADAMQAAGDLVRVVVEFTAGVQHGHDDLGRRAVLFLVDVDRDAAAVVGDGDGFVGVDRDDDPVAVAGQRLVDRVVDDLENHVVQAGAVIGVADVHSGALSDRSRPFNTLILVES